MPAALYQTQAQRLHYNLLQTFYHGIKNLVFCLDHLTPYIPMNAWFDGEQYLVENYSISSLLAADLTDVRDRLPSGTQNTSVNCLFKHSLV